MRLLWIICEFVGICFSKYLDVGYFDLGSANLGSAVKPQKWNFCSNNNSIESNIRICGESIRVPGDIYSDLLATNFIKNPLFGNRDIDYRWIGRTSWIYGRNFTISKEILNKQVIILNLEGIDTISTVLINNKFLLKTNNQFVNYQINIKKYLLFQTNNITIVFESPLKFATAEALHFEALIGHRIPPDCTATVQNGECHVQFLRKIQSSFSWDWGPAFPTMGIWKPVYFNYYDEIFLHDFYPCVKHENDNYFIDIVLSFFCLPYTDFFLYISIDLNEIDVHDNCQIKYHCENKELQKIKIKQLAISNSSKFELWYPRNYGKQKLYDLSINFNAKTSKFDRLDIK